MSDNRLTFHHPTTTFETLTPQARALLFAFVARVAAACACAEDASQTARSSTGAAFTGEPSAAPADSAASGSKDADTLTATRRLTEQGEDLVSLWGSGPADVFAIGTRGSILHYDGRDWTRQFVSPHPLNSLWGSSKSDVYAVGYNSDILHYDGTRWSSTGIKLEWYASVWAQRPTTCMSPPGRDSTTLTEPGGRSRGWTNRLVSTWSGVAVTTS